MNVALDQPTVLCDCTGLQEQQQEKNPLFRSWRSYKHFNANALHTSANPEISNISLLLN